MLLAACKNGVAFDVTFLISAAVNLTYVRETLFVMIELCLNKMSEYSSWSCISSFYGKVFCFMGTEMIFCNGNSWQHTKINNYPSLEILFDISKEM